MYQFIESIKVQDGIIHNLNFHQNRVNRTLEAFYNGYQIQLDQIQIPDIKSKGIYKLRIIYSHQIDKYELIKYEIKSIKNLKIIKSDSINYQFKYFNRKALNELFLSRSEFDDILIVKNGLVTDTSFCNVVFDDGINLFTPIYPLLKGTKREFLHSSGQIQEKEISLKDISDYSKIHLINSMINLGECTLNISDIYN